MKSHVIISPNLIGQFYWRLAVEREKNRGNGQTWRVPANLIANIWYVIFPTKKVYRETLDYVPYFSLHFFRALAASCVVYNRT